MPRRLSHLRLIVTSAFALTATLPVAAHATTPQPPQAGWLFTQTAARGTLTPTDCNCRGRFILTLRDVAAQMVWFADRPARGTGQLAAGAFTRRWANFGFQADHPNAAVTLLDAGQHADTLVVELLSRPRYDRRRRTMRYHVRRLSHASGTLARFEASRDRRIPGRFGYVSLFIDDGDDPQTARGPRRRRRAPAHPSSRPGDRPAGRGRPRLGGRLTPASPTDAPTALDQAPRLVLASSGMNSWRWQPGTAPRLTVCALLGRPSLVGSWSTMVEDRGERGEELRACVRGSRSRARRPRTCGKRVAITRWRADRRSGDHNVVLRRGVTGDGLSVWMWVAVVAFMWSSAGPS